MNEGVMQRFADVLVRQGPLGVHDAAWEVPNFECFLILSSPPVVLGAAKQEEFEL